jgi:hypothetical protein
LRDQKARRNIQAACAFDHFKFNYEDKLPAGESFEDEDHYFFEQILQQKYPQEQFSFGKDDLHLSDQMEAVLFKWAFEKPRPKNKENPNIFYKAESIRSWNEMRRYDDQNGTSFASNFDVAEPGKARPMKTVEVEFLSHKAQQSPVDALETLIKQLKELHADTLRSEKPHLVPMLKEVTRIVGDYLKMLDAVK